MQHWVERGGKKFKNNLSQWLKGGKIMGMNWIKTADRLPEDQVVDVNSYVYSVVVEGRLFAGIGYYSAVADNLSSGANGVIRKNPPLWESCRNE